MGQNVASFILKRLIDWDVDRVWGYPGDGINGLIGAFHQHGEQLPFVQVRHEEIAAFAATAQAKFTGRVAVCMATSGPGAIHLLNGLYDAKLDHQPVVAIVGQQKRMSLGGHYQQEVHLTQLFSDVAAEFCEVCMTPEQAPHLIDRAVRIAEATRSPTCVIVPSDVQEAAFEEPPRAHGALFSAPTRIEPAHVVPPREELQRAAEVLNAGERVAVLIGQGARNARAELEQLADVLGCGIAKALNGRDVLPDTLPYVTGPIGLLGSKPTNDMIESCDTLLMIGSSFPYSEWLPEPGQARGVQIDLDGRMIGIRYPMEVNLVGDAKDTLRALLPLLERKPDRSWQQEIEQHVDRWWRILDDRAHQDPSTDGMLNPQLVFHELSQRLPDRVMLTADSGSATNWWARHLRLRDGMSSALSGTLATMCPAVPYALAAKFAHPDRPVIAALGDGAMQMLGINALVDVAHYTRQGRFSNPTTIILVLNNRDLNQVTWEQRVLAGDAKLDASQVLPDFPYARYAEMLGITGIRVDKAEDVGAAWDTALSAGSPVVFEAVTDPEVPPLPPHIRFDQAKNMAAALASGEPDAVRIAKEAIKGKFAEFANR